MQPVASTSGTPHSRGYHVKVATFSEGTSISNTSPLQCRLPPPPQKSALLCRKAVLSPVMASPPGKALSLLGRVRVVPFQKVSL